MDPGGAWTTTIDSDLEGKKVLLRLHAQARPELSLECELSHSLPTLQILPQHSRVKVTTRAGNHRYETEALVQMEGCAVRGRGLVESQRGLRGSLVFRNNCSVIQVKQRKHSHMLASFLSDVVILPIRSGPFLTA